jgi:hypothetical protein
MTKAFRPVFARLRDLLHAHESDFTITHDTPERYGLEAPVGPATVRAWGGTVRTATIPVACVEMRKTYVSYHLMGVSGNAKLVASLSTPLQARMQGQACFNFTTVDETLFLELQTVTAESLRGMKHAGFIADRPAPERR